MNRNSHLNPLGIRRWGLAVRHDRVYDRWDVLLHAGVRTFTWTFGG